MISVEEVWKLSNDLANKWQTGAQFKPAQFNRYIKIVVYDIARKYYGRPEDYQINNSTAPIAYERTQLISDYVDAYKVSDHPLKLDKYGKSRLPDNYMHFDSAEYKSYQSSETTNDTEQEVCSCNCEPCTCNNKTVTTHYKAVSTATKKIVKTIHAPIVIVKSSMWASYLNDPIRFPTLEFPIGKFTGSRIMQFAPVEMKTVLINYLRMPATPYRNYTPINGDSVYVPNGSTNIELPEELTKEVVMGMLYCIGINTREMDLSQIAQAFKQSGL